MDDTGQLDYDRLADLIMRKLEKKVLRMPDEFRENVQKPYYAAPITIPLYNHASHYYLLEIYVTDVGGMRMRIKDEYGRQISEKDFL